MLSFLNQIGAAIRQDQVPSEEPAVHQQDKQDQLLLFSRTVSNLQNKAREHKYQERLKNMQNRTMYMLVVTGGGVMVLLILSMTIFLSI